MSDWLARDDRVQLETEKPPQIALSKSDVVVWSAWITIKLPSLPWFPNCCIVEFVLFTFVCGRWSCVFDCVSLFCTSRSANRCLNIRILSSFYKCSRKRRKKRVEGAKNVVKEMNQINKEACDWKRSH